MTLSELYEYAETPIERKRIELAYHIGFNEGVGRAVDAVIASELIRDQEDAKNGESRRQTSDDSR